MDSINERIMSLESVIYLNNTLSPEFVEFWSKNEPPNASKITKSIKPFLDNFSDKTRKERCILLIKIYTLMLENLNYMVYNTKFRNVTITQYNDTIKKQIQSNSDIIETLELKKIGANLIEKLELINSMLKNENF